MIGRWLVMAEGQPWLVDCCKPGGKPPPGAIERLVYRAEPTKEFPEGEVLGVMSLEDSARKLPEGHPQRIAIFEGLGLAEKNVSVEPEEERILTTPRKRTL